MSSFLAPPLLTSISLSKSFAARTILAGVSLTVAAGERIGVVGPNGSGKSTLLRILAGLEPPDSGRAEVMGPTVTVGYLPQETTVDEDTMLMSFLRWRTGAAGAAREMEERGAAMNAAVAAGKTSRSSLGSIQAYTDSVERYAALGGDDLEARAEVVLDRVGLDAGALHRPMGSLSGGERARAHLAGLLLARLDVFLLDEPTNDLDLEGLELLEGFVDDAPGAMMIVSHDRVFLERCVTSVLELDGVGGEARSFSGGYEAYVRERELARRVQRESYERYQSERKRLLEEARRRKTWSASGAARAKRSPRDGDKFIKAGGIEGAENSASKASVAERKLERLETGDKPWEGWRLELSFGSAPRSGDIVARLDAAVMKRGDFTLGPLDLDVRWGDRVLVTGANGTGKSTLIAALLGDLELASGRRHLGVGVRIGVMEQDRGAFDQERSWLGVLCERSGLLEESARSLLAKFGLGPDDVTRPARSLSPGERSRATLALLAAKEANCLVLDEPTNHLDVEAIEQLERALAEFDGTVILITHDRRLIQAYAPTHHLGIQNGG